jgi:hypothetical protein
MTIRALVLLFVMLAMPFVASSMTGAGRAGLHHRAHYHGWELVVLPSNDATEFALFSGRGTRQQNNDDEDTIVPLMTLAQLEDHLNQMRPRSIVSVHYKEQKLSNAEAAELRNHLREVCRSNRLRCVFAI